MDTRVFRRGAAALALAAFSQALCGCLLTMSHAKQAATTYDWPQAARSARWERGGAALTVLYESVASTGGAERAKLRELTLDGETLEAATMDVEAVPGEFPAGIVGKRLRAWLPRLAERVRDGAEPAPAVRDGPDGKFYVFDNWRGVKDAMQRLRRGERVVYRKKSGFDDRPHHLYSVVLVLVPTPDGRVAGVPLPDRESSRLWYKLALPFLVAVDVITSPVTGLITVPIEGRLSRGPDTAKGVRSP